jgi:hypothetical protein
MKCDVTIVFDLERSRLVTMYSISFKITKKHNGKQQHNGTIVIGLERTSAHIQLTFHDKVKMN